MAGPAPQPAPATVNVKIDGVPYTVPKGANVLDACLKAGRANKDYPDQREGGPHYVPHFCWHPGLSISGNCRMCFVKVTTYMKKGDALVPNTMPTIACNSTVAEGMEIDTKSAEVQKIRAGIMDLELLNHPLDCPECDKAGECRLQDYDFDYGHDHSKFDFQKVDRHIKSLGSKINIWGTRCILCSRCIRVCDEISGTAELAFVNRGERSVIDIFPTRPLENSIALNTVEVCPVGALKNKDFLYTARVWNLDENAGVCGLCSKGCATRVDSLKGVVKRIMARENLEVNGFWVCDQGRLDYKWVNSEKRFDRPLIKGGSGDRSVSWASGYTRAAEALKKMSAEAGEAWVLTHASATNEELWLVKQIAQALGLSNIAVIAAPDREPVNYPGFKVPQDANANRAGARAILGVENAEDSVAKFVAAAKEGKAKHVFVLGGAPHGLDGLPQVADALGQQAVGNIVAIDFQQSVLTDLAHVALAGQTWFENGGSWINGEGRLQAFRASLPFGLKGRAMTEILQELLSRVAPQPAAQAVATSQAQVGGTATATVATEAPKVTLGAAALFDELAKSVPQFAGHSHLSLIRSKGAKLS
jgi:NADH-quinone oxidoreductase subunit G